MNYNQAGPLSTPFYVRDILSLSEQQQINCGLEYQNNMNYPMHGGGIYSRMDDMGSNYGPNSSCLYGTTPSPSVGHLQSTYTTLSPTVSAMEMSMMGDSSSPRPGMDSMSPSRLPPPPPLTLAFAMQKSPVMSHEVTGPGCIESDQSSHVTDDEIKRENEDIDDLQGHRKYLVLYVWL